MGVADPLPLAAMSFAALALLPVFLVILIGVLLHLSGLMSEAQWAGIHAVCYYVLFPAIIVKEIAGADFTSLPVLSMALALVGGLSVVFALLLLVRRPLCLLLSLDGPGFSSFFQGVTRWHQFIAFAIVPPLYGPHSLALAALTAAIITPLLNVVNVSVIAHSITGPRPPGTILLAITRNPFVLSCLVGIAINVSGMPIPPLGVTVLDTIGKGALGLALLSVGAGLQFAMLRQSGAAVVAATVLKLIAVPSIVVAAMAALGVTGEARDVAVLCTAVPTGSGAYILARQMGGDAPLIAAIMTCQVVAAAFTLPLIVTLLAA
jgi:predicted permease